MSGHLWKAFLEHDVATFRAVLEAGIVPGRSGNGPAPPAAHRGAYTALSDGLGSLELGSPDWLSSTPQKGKAVTRNGTASSTQLSRADLNHRDPQGRTLLHLVASSKDPNAIEFAHALLEHPFTDIYTQDTESGWTALHRALYEGSISIALAILTRDAQDAYDAATPSFKRAGGLIKIKDNEGNGPLDLLEQTFEQSSNSYGYARREYDTALSSDSDSDEGDDMADSMASVAWDARGRLSALHGEEVYTFGSNKNMTLGFGDEDDRQFPELVTTVRRPDHVLERLWRRDRKLCHDTSFPEDVPSHIQFKQICAEEVIMGWFSSAILTDDPISNLHICGYGSGGRLGLGDERTRFKFTCVDTSTIRDKKVIEVALGHLHTIALTSDAELFSWGSNTFGQLGYALPKSSQDEDPVQLVPRQIYGQLKKESIIGVAASGIHSVVYGRDAVWTFGKNEGQLGIVDSDARSLEMVTTPRKISGTIWNSNIASVSAIDRATICLLSSREVWIYANYGFARLPFPDVSLQSATFRFRGQYNSYARHDDKIEKVAAGGDTIAALTTTGNIFTLQVTKPRAPTQGASTTNPAKIKAALTPSTLVWSNRKTRLAAHDVAIDQNGSVIVVTDAGSVWRRVKRANIKTAATPGVLNDRPRDFKFSRIPGLTSISAVRASGIGAYAAVRKPKIINEHELRYSESSLEKDLLELSPFAPWSEHFSWHAEDPLRYLAKLVVAKETETLDQIISQSTSGNRGDHIALATTASDAQVYVHQFLLAAISPKLLDDITHDREGGLGAYSIEQLSNGHRKITFNDVGIWTVVNLVLFAYTRHVLRLWQYDRNGKNAIRFRAVRSDLISLAAILEIKDLANITRERSPENRNITNALTAKFNSQNFDMAALPGVDAVVKLEDGQRRVHSALMCLRCPFFESLFRGRADGRWLSGRNHEEGLVPIDLADVNTWAFDRLLQWCYLDRRTDLFKDVYVDSMDDYMDRVIDVLLLANEMMMDSLSQICQCVLGDLVNIRNVCYLLSSIGPCTVTSLKDYCLKFICYNLEAIMRHGHLEELDEELLAELNEVARSIQLNGSHITRSGKMVEALLERNPQLQERILKDRQAKIDSIVLLNKYSTSVPHASSSFRAGSFHDFDGIPKSTPTPRNRRRSSHGLGSPSPSSTPLLKGKASASDLLFLMDDEERISMPSSAQDNVAGSSHAESSAVTPRSRTKDQMSPIMSSPIPLEFSRSPSGPTPTRSASGHPWTPLDILTPNKLSMRDIMSQASTPQVSNLSEGFKRANATDRKTSSGQTAAKLSQRERKRLQQQQASQTVPEPKPDTPVQSSPWKAVPKPKAKPMDSQSPIHSAGPPTPQMTMRQTIANPSSGKRKEPATPVQKPMTPPVQKQTPTAPTATQSQSPIQPRSIRHTPMPARISLLPENMSMRDIQSQQTVEKIIASGGGEKRSIQDIQTEQEFQEWWEKESARVQEEEQARSHPSGSNSRRGGRRGGGKRAVSGKHDGESKARGPRGGKSSARGGAKAPTKL